MTAREGSNMTRSVRGVLAALSASTTLGALLITGVSTASATAKGHQLWPCRIPREHPRAECNPSWLN